jgi:hypothetical protein
MRQAKHYAIRLILLTVCCGGNALAQAAPAAPAHSQLTAPAAGDAHSAAMTDIDHLLQLARELKADVDKTRRDELSVQVIREADEIEKLARSAKARIH